MTKISGGSARGGQAMLIFFFTPLILFLTYIIVSKNLSLQGVSVLIMLYLITCLILRNAFSYGDVYRQNDKLLIKKLFTTNNRQIIDIKDLDTSLLPFTFYFEFQDAKKVFFFSNTSDLMKQLNTLDPEMALQIMNSKASKRFKLQ
jgi:hypothetical protein